MNAAVAPARSSALDLAIKKHQNMILNLSNIPLSQISLGSIGGKAIRFSSKLLQYLKARWLYHSEEPMRSTSIRYNSLCGA
jgi:hypothetical protein